MTHPLLGYSGACPTRTATSLGSNSCLRSELHARVSTSSSLPPGVISGDEEGFRVYGEQEADRATRLPISRDLQRHSMEVALICTRCVRAPSRISTVTHIIFTLLFSFTPSLQDATTRRVATQRAANPILAPRMTTHALRSWSRKFHIASLPYHH
jgi:hypothetical protein